MTEDPRSHLLSFLRAGGNVLPIMIRSGSVCTLRKRYERMDARGEGVGRPTLDLTVDPEKIVRSATLLGTSVLPGTDGEIFVLEAEAAPASTDDLEIVRYGGIGTGLYRIRPERGHVCRLADGSFVVAPTEAGLRRKLARMTSSSHVV